MVILILTKMFCRRRLSGYCRKIWLYQVLYTFDWLSGYIKCIWLVNRGSGDGSQNLTLSYIHSKIRHFINYVRKLKTHVYLNNTWNYVRISMRNLKVRCGNSWKLLLAWCLLQQFDWTVWFHAIIANASVVKSIPIGKEYSIFVLWLTSAFSVIHGLLLVPVVQFMGRCLPPLRSFCTFPWKMSSDQSENLTEI
jgi:hypothetical protein